jgi:hypothetical protein
MIIIILRVKLQFYESLLVLMRFLKLIIFRLLVRAKVLQNFVIALKLKKILIFFKGIDFKIKNIEIGDKKIKLQIW